MLNDKNDTFYPFETSQKPLFNLLGTHANEKKMIVIEGGHLVRSELIKESLAWFDNIWEKLQIDQFDIAQNSEILYQFQWNSKCYNSLRRQNKEWA